MIVWLSREFQGCYWYCLWYDVGGAVQDFYFNNAVYGCCNIIATDTSLLGLLLKVHLNSAVASPKPGRKRRRDDHGSFKTNKTNVTSMYSF